MASQMEEITVKCLLVLPVFSPSPVGPVDLKKKQNIGSLLSVRLGKGKVSSLL